MRVDGVKLWLRVQFRVKSRGLRVEGFDIFGIKVPKFPRFRVWEIRVGIMVLGAGLG